MYVTIGGKPSSPLPIPWMNFTTTVTLSEKDAQALQQHPSSSSSSSSSAAVFQELLHSSSSSSSIGHSKKKKSREEMRAAAFGKDVLSSSKIPPLKEFTFTPPPPPPPPPSVSSATGNSRNSFSKQQQTTTSVAPVKEEASPPPQPSLHPQSDPQPSLIDTNDFLSDFASVTLSTPASPFPMTAATKPNNSSNNNFGSSSTTTTPVASTAANAFLSDLMNHPPFPASPAPSASTASSRPVSTATRFTDDWPVTPPPAATTSATSFSSPAVDPFAPTSAATAPPLPHSFSGSKGGAHHDILAAFDAKPTSATTPLTPPPAVKTGGGGVGGGLANLFPSIPSTSPSSSSPLLTVDFQEFVKSTDKANVNISCETAGKIFYQLQNYHQTYPITVQMATGGGGANNVVKEFQSNEFSFIQNKSSRDLIDLQFDIEKAPPTPPPSHGGGSGLPTPSGDPIITYKFQDTFKPMIMKAKYKLQYQPTQPFQLLIQIALNASFNKQIIKGFKLQISLNSLAGIIPYETILLDNGMSARGAIGQYDQKKNIWTITLEEINPMAIAAPGSGGPAFLTFVGNIQNYQPKALEEHFNEVLTNSSFPMIIKAQYNDSLISGLQVENLKANPPMGAGSAFPQEDLKIKKSTLLEYRFH